MNPDISYSRLSSSVRRAKEVSYGKPTQKRCRDGQRFAVMYLSFLPYDFSR